MLAYLRDSVASRQDIHGLIDFAWFESYFIRRSVELNFSARFDYILN